MQGAGGAAAPPPCASPHWLQQCMAVRGALFPEPCWARSCCAALAGPPKRLQGGCCAGPAQRAPGAAQPLAACFLRHGRAVFLPPPSARYGSNTVFFCIAMPPPTKTSRLRLPTAPLTRAPPTPPLPTPRKPCAHSRAHAGCVLCTAAAALTFFHRRQLARHRWQPRPPWQQPSLQSCAAGQQRRSHCAIEACRPASLGPPWQLRASAPWRGPARADCLVSDAW